ncbi:MAG TPA: hypothetical protein DCE14_07645 [Kosmotogaceae bacterium]|jgi:hypothetical protein|nr:hypothetical protein [Kosmotogaceae bacterium]
MKDAGLLIGIALTIVLVAALLSVQESVPLEPYKPNISPGSTIHTQNTILSWEFKGDSRTTVELGLSGIFKIGEKGQLILDISGTAPISCTVYEVYFGDSPNPPLYEIVRCQREIVIRGLERGHTYYWQVIAITEAGQRYSGPLWWFHVD